MDPITLIIVCPLVFLAGLVDSIAGGGGLISLTSYLIAGLPAHAALGTNKLSSAIGTIVATVRMAKGGYIKLRLAVPAALGALAGSAIGAKLAMLTPDNVFEMLLIVALPFVAFAVLRKRAIDVPDDVSISPRKQYAIVATVSVLIGAYDGFYGPGTGTFLLLTFTKLGKLDMEKATGNVKVVNLTSNISALITFILAGKILWVLGLSASIFSIAGHYLGAHMVVKNGVKVIKPIILLVLVLLMIKIILGI